VAPGVVVAGPLVLGVVALSPVSTVASSLPVVVVGRRVVVVVPDFGFVSVGSVPGVVLGPEPVGHV
jgi:hypothetical protein